MSILKRFFQGGLSAAVQNKGEVAEILVLDPSDGPVYVVGDVHGCLAAYRSLEALIFKDAQNFEGVATIVLLGDLVDRGPETAALLDHLMMRQKAGVRLLCLMGNHEEMMLQFAAAPKANIDWLGFGGYETLVSYGLTADLDDLLRMNERKLTQTFTAHVPDRHLQFLRSCLPGLQVGQYLLAHAGADPEETLVAQPLRALIWGSAGQTAPNGMTLIHGHYIVTTPTVSATSVAIDTGAYVTGRLTCLRLVQGQQMSVMTINEDNLFKELASDKKWSRTA